MKKTWRVTTTFEYQDGTQSTVTCTKPYKKWAEDQAKYDAAWVKAHGRKLISTTIEEIE